MEPVSVSDYSVKSVSVNLTSDLSDGDNIRGLICPLGFLYIDNVGSCKTEDCFLASGRVRLVTDLWWEHWRNVS